MAFLPSSPDGFIIGKASESLDRIASEIAVLKAIHSDTTATLTQLTAIAHSLERAQTAPTLPPEVQLALVQPSRKPAAPRDTESPQSCSTIAPRVSRERDTSGRWQSKPISAGDTPEVGQDPVGSRASVAAGAARDSLRGAAGAVAHGADGIDPTVQAAKEIGGIFSPLGSILKPMGRLFGRGRTPEQKNQRENIAWYRRIWSAVKNPKGGSGGMGLMLTALLSMLSMLLAPIKALGRLLGMGSLAKMLGNVAGRLLPGRRDRTRARPSSARASSAPGAADGSRRPRPGSSAGSAGAGDMGSRTRGASAPERAARNTRRAPRGLLGKGLDLGKSLLGKAGGLFGGAKLGKSLLRKIPVLGSLLGAGMVASAFMKDEDPNASPEEKASAKADKWGTVGGVAGGAVGAALGTLLGPLGTIAGGIAGDYVGSLMGEWLSTVDFSAVSKTITDTYSAVAAGTLDLASSAYDSLKGAWNGMVASGTELLTGMTDSVKQAFGTAVDSLLSFKDTIADKIQGAKDYVGEKATGVKDAGQNLLNTVTGGRYTGGSNARKDELIKAMDAGGITDQKSKAMLMANVDHESGGFTKNEENLNYSAKRLQEVFPKYYSTPEAARADAGNPEAIANRVYGGRMGNTDAGDGFKYRGRGDIQLTGKDQYADMGKKLGIDLVNNPDLAKDPKISAQIAVQHWKSSGADRAAMTGDQDRARKLTNGGTNGLADVKSKYDGYLAQAQAGDLTPTRRADEGKVQAPEGANTAIASTMTAMRGTPAIGMMPIAPRAGVAAPMMGAQTVGVMAPTAPAIGGASLAPVSAVSMVAPSYTPPAPDASALKIPPTPAVEKPLVGASKPAAPTNVQLSVPLSQGLEDRQIAHVSSGGIGMM